MNKKINRNVLRFNLKNFVIKKGYYLAKNDIGEVILDNNHQFICYIDDYLDEYLRQIKNRGFVSNIIQHLNNQYN